MFFWTERVESPVWADVLQLTVVAMPPSNAVPTFGQSAGIDDVSGNNSNGLPASGLPGRRVFHASRARMA